MFPQSDDKQRVLDATDIVRLIGEHITLRAKGREYLGLCPFHDDHKPSMCVVPHKQMYHCFSCGTGGNAFSFVMNYHKMGFREALEYLAERANVTLTPLRARAAGARQGAGPDDAPPDLSRAQLLAANQTGCDFFRAILSHPEHGRAARAVIERRRISQDVADLFLLGAAPDKWDGLIRTIASKSIPQTAFAAVGLLKAREAGAGGEGHYDSFRNRLIFPIQDQIGRVIAFGGRRIDEEDEPKYLNSPESALFDKSSTLYALHQAAQAIRTSRTAIVTEGYMDAIACHQAGIANVVATLGTALTPLHARVLRRLCDTVVLLFDGDDAGQRAADRALEAFFAAEIDVKIAVMSAVTDAKDPDELLKRAGGTEAFGSVIAGAVDALEYRFARLGAKAGSLGLSARTRLVEDDIARLVDLGLNEQKPVRKQLIIKHLARLVGVDEAAIRAAIPDRRRVRAFGVGAAPEQQASPSADLAVAATSRRSIPERLLGCVLCDPTLLLGLAPEQRDVLSPEAYPHGPMRTVATTVESIAAEGREPSLQAVVLAMDDPQAQSAAVALEANITQITESSPDRLHANWAEWLVTGLRERAIRAMALASEAPHGGHRADAGPGWDEAAADLERRKTLAATVGTDPRSLPRAASG